MKKLALSVLLIGLLLAPCMEMTALEASNPGNGFYSNQQLEEQFGINITSLMSQYKFDAITVSLAPVEVYFATNSANNTREMETSHMEMNHKNIELQAGQEKTLHLSGTDTVSEGGQWAGKYTIQRGFEADVTLSVEQKSNHTDPYEFTLRAANILWTNTMNRTGSDLTVTGEEKNDPSSITDLGSENDYPYGVNLHLVPEKAMHKKTAYARTVIYVTAVKPSTETLAMLKSGSGASAAGDPDTAAKPNEQSGRIDQIIDTDAEKTDGEAGFSVIAAVVLGAAAAVAGVAGAGAAGAAAGSSGGAAGVSAGSSGGESQNPEEDPSYQMIIGKDFGNALKFGQKQRVWARMVEMKKGVSVDRPDLTEGISIFSSEVLVGAASLHGTNMEAEVQIQENAPPEGVISFLYSGAHGSFQNNVRFKLLGKGEIKLVSDKVSILSTDGKPFELIYELCNFTEEEPPLEITASSGLVALDMGKNNKQQTVVLIKPGPDAEPWDHKDFTKLCKCEITAMDGKLPVKATFEVNVCFEGIGAAYTNLPLDEIPADALIECFTEKEKQKREEKALWIPLTVMKWDEKRRVLESDTAKTDALTFTCEVHPAFEFKSPESRALAERVVTKAKIMSKMLPPPPSLEMDIMKKPSAYRLLASADPDEGAAPFDIQITVSCEGDTSLEALPLKAQIKPNPDLKGMVRWFLEYPIGSAAAEFITLGNVTTYHKALDFIESRVYPMSGVPWSANLLWNKEDSSHYETGRYDIMRKSYIAIQDHKFPKGIGESEFKNVQTLVHELAHVIEDQHGEYKVDDKSERHSYYLEHLSDLSRGLVGLENPTCTIDAEIQYAINGAYWHYVDPEIIGDLSNIGPWFGGEFKLSVHELFDKYAYHIDTLSGKMTGAHREAVSKAFRHWYFPGNLSELEVQRGVKVDAIGRFVETDGLFKDAEWIFRWNQGVLSKIELVHGEYTFEIEDYYWLGGRELKLMVRVIVRDKKDPSFSYDSVSIILDGGTYDMSARLFPYVRSFSANWKSLNDHQHSLLFKKTGLNEFTSFTTRKK